jgi:hypothetical protein
MPVYRRRFQTSIAKVNARSVDGYFGEGTPCFFIRGTILSDVQVDGEYRTLAIQRPGNVIEIEDFDGVWATLLIHTRAGSRPGDNLTARMVMRDVDLRASGIDCERIMAGLGTFEAPEEPVEPEPIEEPVAVLVPEPLPPPPPPLPPPPPTNGFGSGLRKPTIDIDFVPEPEPEDRPLRDELAANVPEPEHGAEPEVIAAAAPVEKFIPAPEVLIVPPTSEEPAADTQTVIDRITAQAEPSRPGGTLFGGRTAIADGRVLVEVGTGAIVAIGLPVVLYFLREMFNDRKKKKGG